MILRLKSVGMALTNLIKSLGGKLLLTLYTAFGFINIYLIYKYTKELKHLQCNCENEIQEH